MTYDELQRGGSHKRCIPRFPENLKMRSFSSEWDCMRTGHQDLKSVLAVPVLNLTLRREAIKNIWPIWSLLLVAHSQNVPELMSHVSHLAERKDNETPGKWVWKGHVKAIISQTFFNLGWCLREDRKNFTTVL